jgi:hypothetical protein
MIKGLRIKMHEGKRAAVMLLVALDTLLLAHRCMETGSSFDPRPEVCVAGKAMIVGNGPAKGVALCTIPDSLKLRMRHGQFPRGNLRKGSLRVSLEKCHGTKYEYRFHCQIPGLQNRPAGLLTTSMYTRT